MTTWLWRPSVVVQLVALSVVFSADSAAASGWTTVPTPNPSGALRSTLSAVSCTSPQACTAVGNYTLAAAGQFTLAERWDGSRWQIQPTPDPLGSLSSSLSGISCPRARQCVAVGHSGQVPLVERWNGTSWTIQPTPAVLQGAFSAVSCRRSGACTAVGEAIASAASPQLALAERYNGNAWTIQPVPSPAGTENTALDGVSCPARNVCTAVGDQSTHAIPYSVVSTLVERWSGGSWAIQPTTNPTGAQDTYLYGVSCPRARVCTAVGSSLGQITTTVAERWSGASWGIEPTPDPPQSVGATQSSLLSVSCSSRTACTAVGSSTSPDDPSLAERYNGTSWMIQPTPSGGAFSALSGVSCPTAAACVAVGGSGFRFTGTTLADHWSS